MPRSFELIWASEPAQLFPLVTFCILLLNIDSSHLAKWARSIEVLLTWNWLILCARMSSPKRCFLSASKNRTSFRNGANWGWRRPLQALKNRISTSGREFSDSKIGFVCTPTLWDIKLFAFKVGCFHHSQIAITPPSYAETSAWNGLRAKFQGVHVFFPALTDLLIKWYSLFHLLKTALEEWWTLSQIIGTQEPLKIQTCNHFLFKWDPGQGFKHVDEKIWHKAYSIFATPCTLRVKGKEDQVPWPVAQRKGRAHCIQFSS